MSKRRKPKKRTRPGAAPSAEQGGQALAALEQIVGALSDASPPGDWGEVQHALFRTPADRQRVMRIVMARDLPALRDLVDELAGRSSVPSADSADVEVSPSGPTREFDHELLKRAMRAFRKRLKLARLDDESRLGVGPMTGGKHSEIRAILPPHEFQREVWEELARRGELRDMGQGFFELAEEPGR